MNSLLKRQIRKYLPKELHHSSDLENFLDAVDRSYTTSDEQFIMLQRATKISSEELFTANELLVKETESQKKVIKKLESVIDNLGVYDLNKNRPKENSDTLKLADFIDNQTKEIVKINHQKDELVKSLKQQNKELEDYAHMISHDLKSPLQSIDTLIHWIQEDNAENLNDVGKENLYLIQENVEKIDKLINGILKYATIGKINKETYNVNINDLLLKLKNKFEKNTNANISLNRNLPIIKGDNYKLNLLFSNLIDNAIKFNNKQNKEVIIDFKEDENYYIFSIKDNGKGIEEPYFIKIFETFMKLEDDYKSTGIGLSIVKKIVEFYQGKIWLESTLNLGSTFYFSLKK